MVGNVREQQTAGIKDAAVFSIALDESTDVNDVVRGALLFNSNDRHYLRRGYSKGVG